MNVVVGFARYLCAGIFFKKIEAETVVCCVLGKEYDLRDETSAAANSALRLGIFIDVRRVSAFSLGVVCSLTHQREITASRLAAARLFRRLSGCSIRRLIASPDR